MTYHLLTNSQNSGEKWSDGSLGGGWKLINKRQTLNNPGLLTSKLQIQANSFTAGFAVNQFKIILKGICYTILKKEVKMYRSWTIEMDHIQMILKNVG